jgi:GntR family transcriptional repressor for pyruvate dehydrogenase complex
VSVHLAAENAGHVEPPGRRGRRGVAMEDAAVRPVRRTNLSAAIADRIAEQIALGKLQPGCRLQSERELSDLFGVGRSSVREAIKALESRGVVEGRQGEGRFVRAQDVSGMVRALTGPVSVSEREVEQLYEARGIVEPGMAALAAQRAGGREVASVRRLLDKHEERVECGRYGGADDTLFHMKLAAMADNPLLARLLEGILAVLHATREPALRSAPGLSISLAGHWEVVRAIESHDPDAARNAMTVHLGRARQLAVDVVRSHDGLDRSPAPI